MKIYENLYESIISTSNLLSAWEKFRKGKRGRKDVQEFEWSLEPKLFQLHRDLKSHRYQHGTYHTFYIQDPKQRIISKATVRDRIVHQALFNILNPIFEASFIATSFSCRVGKGTHKGVEAVHRMIRRVSCNYTSPCFILKCDIKKFFRSVNHEVITKTFAKRIKCQDTLWLLGQIVSSFPDGMPIGNLTSQLFANIYMNEFDQFTKQVLGVKHYARYTDDFVVVSASQEYLENLLEPIQDFLARELDLELHPNKVSIRKYKQGADFLGYVILPHHRQLRTKTKRRMFKRINQLLNKREVGLISSNAFNQSLESYFGVLGHGDHFTLEQKIRWASGMFRKKLPYQSARSKNLTRKQSYKD